MHTFLSVQVGKKVHYVVVGCEATPYTQFSTPSRTQSWLVLRASLILGRYLEVPFCLSRWQALWCYKVNSKL